MADPCCNRMAPIEEDASVLCHPVEETCMEILWLGQPECHNAEVVGAKVDLFVKTPRQPGARWA